ncbi:MAG: hypothetical protein B1H11_04900 [Desulfobacteraceae bacterium 4484_190.1]|nr:MAG: hypothetical protein B1H11_04900 [Desulfobacteraceae bacterium 4484_190.1]
MSVYTFYPPAAGRDVDFRMVSMLFAREPVWYAFLRKERGNQKARNEKVRNVKIVNRFSQLAERCPELQ